MQGDEYYDPDDVLPTDTLTAVRPDLSPESERFSPPSPTLAGAQAGHSHRINPGDVVLIHGLAGHDTVYSHLHHDSPETLSEGPSDIDSAMTERPEGTDGAGESSTEPTTSPADAETLHDQAASVEEPLANVDPALAGETSVSGLKQSVEKIDTQDLKTELASRVRVDSAQDNIQQLPLGNKASHGEISSPLRITTSSENVQPPSLVTEDSITASPTLAKHLVTASEDTVDTLRPLEPTSPTQDGVPSSPHNVRLPSFRQLSRDLPAMTALAEAATQQAAAQAQQAYSHHHSESFGSATSQSPILTNHPYPLSAQTSPASYSHYAQSIRSPTSTTSEAPQYGSPTRAQAYGPYMPRRSLTLAEYARHPPPSLPSASSSGESHGHAGSSTDGYSTAHTTPVDQPPTADGTPRPILPPPQNMPIPPGGVMIPGGYTCDYVGCTAAPFQTQYLLR